MTHAASGDAAAAVQLDIARIMTRLPHRYPFLLIDRVVECFPGKSIKAYKNVSVNEPFFQGHFPGLPVMPGVLILEAMAQAGAIMVTCNWEQEDIDKNVYLFAGMDNVRFRQQVVPGDRLDLVSELVRSKRNIWKLTGRAFVNGKIAAEADLTAALLPREAV